MNSRFRLGTSNPFRWGKNPSRSTSSSSFGRVGKPGKERQGIVLDLPGNLLDRAFPLQQSGHLVAGEVVMPAGQPGDGGAHDAVIGLLMPLPARCATRAITGELTSKKAVKVVEPKRMEGEK